MPRNLVKFGTVYIRAAESKPSFVEPFCGRLSPAGENPKRSEGSLSERVLRASEPQPKPDPEFCYRLSKYRAPALLLTRLAAARHLGFIRELRPGPPDTTDFRVMGQAPALCSANKLAESRWAAWSFRYPGRAL